VSIDACWNSLKNASQYFHENRCHKYRDGTRTFWLEVPSRSLAKIVDKRLMPSALSHRATQNNSKTHDYGHI